MRFPLIAGLMLLLFGGLVDYVIYRILRRAFSRQLVARIYGVVSILFLLTIIAAICIPKRNGGDGQLLTVMWMLYAYLTVYIPKYIYLLVRLISRLPRLWHGRPWRVVDGVGLGLGVVIFGAMWWGALINRFNIQRTEVSVVVPQLPASFRGLRIAQISDLHVGTFGHDTAFVSRLVDSVNATRPDIIVFTGDIVNRRSDELRPFLRPLSRLSAPLGVYSIMGNHDYGDYSDWPSPQARLDDVGRLKDMQRQCGLTMLNNDTHWLVRGADSIALIGVENIGDPPFRVYGDLSAAYPDIRDDKVKVLLSHNPAHWEADIEDHDTNVALTLSGHTHAMQMRVWGLSPASLRYDKWGGLYTDTRGQNLYVNIGDGCVGMPYRIGATPEVTVLTLTDGR